MCCRGIIPIVRRAAPPSATFLDMHRTMPVILASTVLALTISGCGSSGKPAVLTVTGDVTTHNGNGGRAGVTCILDGVTSTLPGAPVVVKDNSGKTVGLSSLGTGVYLADPGGALDSSNCSFPFSVTDVPADAPFYTVEVANGVPVTFTKNDVAAPIHLTLNRR